MVGGFLAGVDAAGVGARQIHDAVADQMVENQGVGLGNQAGSLDREQVGVAGAGADQPDLAGLKSFLRFHGANCFVGRSS